MDEQQQFSSPQVTSAQPFSKPEGSPLPKPAMSPWASLARIFFSPRSVFEALAPRPTFLIPLLVILVVQMAAGYFISGSDAVREGTIAKLEAKGAPQEQIDATEKMMGSPVVLVFGTLGAGIGVAFVVFLGAGLLFFMANLMLGAKLTFAHFLCAATYGQLIGIVDSLVRTGLILAKNTLHVQTGLGVLASGDPGYLIRVLDTLTSPLVLWAAAIQALGVSVFARKGFGFGVLCVLPALLLAAVLSGLQG